MRIVLATASLAGLGGSETYVLTVSDQLQRLGHDVWLYARRHGDGSRLAESLGVRLAYKLPPAPDVLVVQDGVVACELATAYPVTPQVFVAHSDLFDFQLPPLLPGLTACVVVLYDRVEARVRALGLDHEVVRLTQPVDLERFKPLSPLRQAPRVALAYSNYIHGERLALLRRACESAGLALWHIGAHAERPGGRGTPAIRRLAFRLAGSLGGERLARLCRLVERREPALTRFGAGTGGPMDGPLTLNQADIVFGKGRVIHEAMACGRAAYVFDHHGASGWVTPASYPRLAADNFGGQCASTGGERRVAEDLAQYDPAMGLANRDLAVRHHSAAKHATALVEVLRRAAPRPASVPGADAELARTIRLLERADSRAFQLAIEAERLGRRIHALEAELAARPNASSPRTAREAPGA